VSNTSGQATAFMALTPIRPGSEAELRAYLDALPRADSPFARLTGTHFARWVIIPDWINDPSQGREDHLGGPYLIFTSNFDGPLDPYLDELCVKLAPEAREIWGRCVGYPPQATGPEFKAYLLHNKIDTGFFVAAYPHATVPQVKAALAAREQLIAFALRTQGMAPAELQRAFGEEFL
jgi:hypothetical protein